MKCTICGIEIGSIDDAISDDWLPYFYEGEVEHGPVCSPCEISFVISILKLDRSED